MNRQRGFSALVVAALVGAAPLASAAPTALDAYVARPDPSYRYVPYHTHSSTDYTTYFVKLTSQQWRTPAEVEPAVWEHELLIIVPRSRHAADPYTAFLILNGGRHGGEFTRNDNSAAAWLAVTTGAITAVLNQIPNQPLAFADEPGRARSGDEILAYGMDKYLTTGDPEWLAQLPMTKAAVRALDTLQVFAASADGRLADASAPQAWRLDNFILLGGSKRGWAIWLAAAVEAASSARVKAILPASIDLLNLDEQFAHHWQAYGFYAPAIRDYAAFNLPCRGKTPAGQAMLAIIDPYEYRDRFTLPKLILNSAGDQFFLPDSSRFYYADLPGPKLLRYTVNTDHAVSQNLLSLIPPALAWLTDANAGKPGPQFSWSLEPDGSIRVQTVTQPNKVLLWQATNPTARDFRLATIGPAWTSTELQDTGDGLYIGSVPPPPQGWTAFTVELTFPGATLNPTSLESAPKYTTDVRVTPADLPFKGGDCPGYPAVGPDRPGLYQPDWRRFQLQRSRAAGEADLTVTYDQAGAGWLPLAGDWDGDGHDSLGLFRPDTRTFYLKSQIGVGRPDTVVTYDRIPAGALPIAGDWDGDGRDTPGVYHPATRTFYLINAIAPDAPVATIALSQARDDWPPLAGDWDGDGRDGVGLFRPDQRTFYLKHEIAAGEPDIVITYDQAPASGVPLAGDWDGDGRDTLGWYRPDTGVFYLNNELSPAGRVIAVPLGPAAADGWRPVAGLWD